VRDRVRTENRLADVPKDGVRDLITPPQAIATGAGERRPRRSPGSRSRPRLQHFERRIAEVSRETARETIDADDFRQRLTASSSA
jgi:hypothetical protein